MGPRPFFRNAKLGMTAMHSALTSSTGATDEAHVANAKKKKAGFSKNPA